MHLRTWATGLGALAAAIGLGAWSYGIAAALAPAATATVPAQTTAAAAPGPGQLAATSGWTPSGRSGSPRKPCPHGGPSSGPARAG
ncbi:MAG: hypothetical protein M0020_03480 [Actinomycetota bacterium]|nr:hypothetical protein [Actinomycetota bacterium]